VKAFISITVCLGVMLLVVAMGEVGRDFTPRIAYTNSLATGGSTAHVYMDFETGNDGDAWVTNNSVGSALLTNAISIGSSLGRWDIITNGNNVNSNTLLRVSTTEAHRGTRSLRVRPTADTSYMRWTMFTGFPKVAWSFWVKFDANWNGNDNGSHDLFDFRATSGDFAICNLDQQSPTGGTNRLKYGAHTGAGVGTKFTFTTNFWYNMQGLWDSNTTGYLLRFYSNGVSLGQSSNVIDAIPRILKEFRMGMCDTHGSFFDALGYIDDGEIWTNGTFPNTPVGGF